MKLTKAQEAMLRRFADGEAVSTISGPKVNAFYRRGLETANMATLHALWGRGLVAATRGAGGSDYTITPAGRDALATYTEREG